jgi:thioesterase domain-containing protein
VTDNFFALGGDSILALQAVIAMRSRGYPNVKLSFFMQNPSVRRILEQMSLDHVPDKQAFAIKFNENPSAPVVAFLPPFGGHVNCYLMLADTLRSSCDVVAFEALALTNIRAVEASLGSAVQPYADYLLRSLKGRACIIIGWSWGGLLAHALGQVLENNIKLGFVGMIDVHNYCRHFNDNAKEIQHLFHSTGENEFRRRMERSDICDLWEQLIPKLTEFEYRALIGYYVKRRVKWSLTEMHPYSEEYSAYTIFNRAVISRRYVFEQLSSPIISWMAEKSPIDDAKSPIDWTPYTKSKTDRIMVSNVDHRSILHSPKLHSSIKEKLILYEILHIKTNNCEQS